jgi:hypothetical protein
LNSSKKGEEEEQGKGIYLFLINKTKLDQTSFEMFTYKQRNFGFIVIKKKQNKVGEVPTSPSDGTKKTKKSKGFQKKFNNGVQIKTKCFSEDQTSLQHSSPIEPK